MSKIKDRIDGLTEKQRRVWSWAILLAAAGALIFNVLPGPLWRVFVLGPALLALPYFKRLNQLDL